jgi:hypothetical protein
MVAKYAIGKHPNSLKNLKPLTLEDRSRGGKNSVRSKKEKMTFREAARAYVNKNCSMSWLEHANPAAYEFIKQHEGDRMLLGEAMIAVITDRAVRGDKDAWKTIIELLGEKAASKIELEGNISYVNKLKEVLGDEM